MEDDFACAKMHTTCLYKTQPPTSPTHIISLSTHTHTSFPLTHHPPPNHTLGQLPLIRISSDLTEAAAILGYAFYMQPMLLPLLHDLPHEGGVGARVLVKSVRMRCVYRVVVSMRVAWIIISACTKNNNKITHISTHIVIPIYNTTPPTKKNVIRFQPLNTPTSLIASWALRCLCTPPSASWVPLAMAATPKGIAC